MGLSNDTFKAFKLEVCTPNPLYRSKSGCEIEKKKYPVTIFSPSGGNSRLLYSAMVYSLASYGNVVVLIDYPYNPTVIEFPNGKIIKGGNIAEDILSLEKLTYIYINLLNFSSSIINFIL
jgi:hypothetical protein